MKTNEDVRNRSDWNIDNKLIMNYGSLLNTLPVDFKNILREKESVNKKIINAEWSLVFNKTCIKENIWPNYTKINILSYAITEKMFKLIRMFLLSPPKRL